jgi:hypothetical protein
MEKKRILMVWMRQLRARTTSTYFLMLQEMKEKVPYQKMWLCGWYSQETAQCQITKHSKNRLITKNSFLIIEEEVQKL